MNATELNASLGTSWHSYPKIWNVGSIELNTFFEDSVIVEEKVDGSQFSFGVFNGEIKVKSKGKELIIDAPEKLFTLAVETVKRLAPMLIDGYTYRGEFLAKPKHNALAYDRFPNNHIIIFDINRGHEDYLTYDEKKAEAERLGLEVVPKLFEGLLQHPQQFRDLMENVSILGGQKIEGIVCKNYTKFGRDKKVLMAKHVSEAFKEVHKSDWKKSNPGNADILQILTTKYKSIARWEKARQHLKERGEYEGSPKDIGNLIKEVQHDIKTECKEDIKEELYQWAIDKILRGSVRGLPEYFKDQLINQQFDSREAFMQELSDIGQLQAQVEEHTEDPEILLTANPEE